MRTTIYGDGKFHTNGKGEQIKKLSRNISEVILAKSKMRVYEVKYTVKELHTKRRFGTLDEAEQYNAICQNLINKKRINDKLDFYEEDLLEYPETLLKALGITDETEGYYEHIVPEFDENFKKASELLREREKNCIISYYKDMMGLDSIGKAMGVTKEKVRQFISKGLRRLMARKSMFTMPKDKYYLISQAEKDKMIAKFESELRASYEEMTYEKALEIVKAKEESDRKSRRTNTSIDELELSVRTYHCLLRAGITTVEELTQKTYNDMWKIRNLGQKSLKELIEKMQSIGLSLKGE